MPQNDQTRHDSYVSSEAILRNTFASLEIKDVRDATIPVKLHLAFINPSLIFID